MKLPVSATLAYPTRPLSDLRMSQPAGQPTLGHYSDMDNHISFEIETY